MIWYGVYRIRNVSKGVSSPLTFKQAHLCKNVSNENDAVSDSQIFCIKWTYLYQQKNNILYIDTMIHYYH